MAGAPVTSARLAVVMVHGRGASAEDILLLAEQFELDDVAYLAPQAANRTWYPYSFLAPMAQNEPGISSGLRRLSRLLDDLASQGLASDRVALLGFSQGACLSLEFAARFQRRYAAVVALSGALITPPGSQWSVPGLLARTPIFLGCSDVDAHIPLERVRDSANTFRSLDGAVDERIYPQMAHTVNRDEINVVRGLLSANGTI
ncbi:MAG: alpha/beta fold hydrolase [Acidobacteria bacterium]|nr:alpha/beta fold hydrolase [Acidobacteriota bacterium]